MNANNKTQNKINKNTMDSTLRILFGYRRILGLKSKKDVTVCKYNYKLALQIADAKNCSL